MNCGDGMYKKIIEFLKDKISLIVLLLVFFLVLIVIFFVMTKPEKYLDLIGPSTVTIYVGDEYEDFGFLTYDKKGNNFDSEVIIDSNLNTDTAGEYEIKYKLADKEVIRRIIVLENSTYEMILEKVNEEETIYLNIGDNYIEPGYKIYDRNGNDITNTVHVQITGEVNIFEEGTYVIVYQFTNSNNEIIKVKRAVIVVDNQINLSLENENYTNENVYIITNIKSAYFDYLILPDGEKIYTKNFIYPVVENGIYEFKIYDKKGLFKTESIEVKNIDKEKPFGTCLANIQDGKTYITINASDNLGIKKYVVDEEDYISNNVIFNVEKQDTNVKIYDEAGNVSIISCATTNKNSTINLIKSNNNYTNSNINILVQIDSDYFSHLKLPNGKIVYSKNYTYPVSENGIYKFIMYDKDGLKKEASIDVNNIDKENPVGTCSAVIKDGITTVDIDASDNSGIKKYMINEEEYLSNKIVFNEEKNSVSVKIYDNVENVSYINCDIVNKNSTIKLKKSTSNNTNSNIDIIIEIDSEYFNYIKLPNGKIVYDKKYTYSVSENGVYKFIMYDKDGLKKEASIEVNNIDKIAPSGSCSGYYQLGTSNIKINATDNVGINKYVLDNVVYNSNNIILDYQIKNPSIIIYDAVGNKKTISCTLEDRNKLITSHEDINFSYKYVKDDIMSYGLFTPSNVEFNERTPLIISLHGSGEINCSQSTFKSKFLVKMFNEDWNLEGFNAYVLFPHLVNVSDSVYWCSDSVVNNLFKLIHKLINELNIDPDKIILEGHSLGGQGVFCIGSNEQAMFSSLVPISGYHAWMSKYENIKVPVRGYIGSASKGEHSSSISFMNTTFKNYFGLQNLFQRDVSHSKIPITAFKEDLNNDNKSDLIEWMLSQ